MAPPENTLPFSDVTRMRMVALEAKKGSTTALPTNETFTVLVNPASYQVDYKANYDKTQATGSAPQQLRFDKIQPQEMGIDLLFDSTGSLGAATHHPGQGVMEQIKSFVDFTLTKKDDKRTPQLLHLIWGPLDFVCRTTGINIKYHHFDTTGKPIRAVASCTFTQDEAFKSPSTVAAPEETTAPAKVIPENEEKHLVNALIKQGNYLQILEQQPSDRKPSTLRGSYKDIDPLYI